ncbi:S-adenosyl-L-methionine-dependent methyltransferase [Mycotypha africana]|uniref:S-adenosyl-L-methionine-dependent methyltransferase n=1 Tax=Mycotypha africana TaxID=64632 RepID=UPI0023006682|nr:S-adenosyl-L-methionine-dependent methyltransferase [Mycotypha africana]KAI8973481.1 S-adenosyl-L-methionine-dependent methyltransferase [Mycotypha africana]
MATEYPAAEFVGIDKVLLFPQTIRPANVTFKQIDVTHGLPFEDNTFDFVHIRLFLLAFNREQWVACLQEIRRVTKPGGYVQLMEDDGDEVVREFASQVERMMNLNDQDPRLCEKLGELLSKNGFTPVEEVKRSVPLGKNTHFTFDTCKPLVIGIYHLTTEEQYQTLKHKWLESRRKSSNSTWFAAVGRNPA